MNGRSSSKVTVLLLNNWSAMEVNSEGVILTENPKNATDVKDEHRDENTDKNVSTAMDSKTEPTSAPTSPTRKSPSPEPNCAICLGQLENKSFTDSCFHQFCFTCLLEWSKVKSVCPLCKTSFQSIIHNVKSIEEYEQYHVRHEQPPTWENPDGRRFRYRSTLTVERRRDLAIRRIYLNHRISHRTGPAPESTTTDNAPRRRTRQTQLSTDTDFRLQVYMRNLRAIPHDQGHRVIRYRETTPRFFHENPACTHRLLPWLSRELNVLLYHNESHVTFVLDIIMSLITRFDIRSQEFREHIQPYIAHRTDQFVHELYNFARSPWDMATYDRNITYLDANRTESSSSDSDVIFVEEARPAASSLQLAPQRRNYYVDVDSPDVVYEPTPASHPFERVRLLLNSVLQEGPSWNSPLSLVAPVWEEEDDASAEVNVTSAQSSPRPGPSGLSSTVPYKAERSLPSPASSDASLSSDDTISVGSSSAVPKEAVADDCPVDPDECLVVGVVKAIKERTPEIIDLVSSDDGEANKASTAVEEQVSHTQPKKKKKKSSSSRSRSRSRCHRESKSNGAGSSSSRSVSSSSRRHKHRSSGSKSKHRRHHRSPNNSTEKRKSSSHKRKRFRSRDREDCEARGYDHKT